MRRLATAAALLVLASGPAGLAAQDLAQVRLAGTPVSLALDPDTDLVYVGEWEGQVEVVDPATMAVVAQAGGFRGWLRLAVDPGLDRLYVAGEGALRALALPSLAPLGEVALGGRPTAVVVHPLTHDVYVATTGPDAVTRLSAEPLGAMASQALPSAPADATLDPVTGRVFLALLEGRVLAFDAELTAALASPPLRGPAGCVAFHPLARSVGVGLWHSAGVAVLDGLTLLPLDPRELSDPVGGLLDRVAWSADLGAYGVWAAEPAPQSADFLFATWETHHWYSRSYVQAYTPFAGVAWSQEVGANAVDLAVDADDLRGYTADATSQTLSVFPLA